MGVTYVQQTITGAAGLAFQPAANVLCNVFIEAISGTLILERSHDGINYVPAWLDASGTEANWTAIGSFVFLEPEQGVYWRFTSQGGSCTYRVSR